MTCHSETYMLGPCRFKWSLVKVPGWVFFVLFQTTYRTPTLTWIASDMHWTPHELVLTQLGFPVNWHRGSTEDLRLLIEATFGNPATDMNLCWQELDLPWIVSIMQWIPCELVVALNWIPRELAQGCQADLGFLIKATYTNAAPRTWIRFGVTWISRELVLNGIPCGSVLLGIGFLLNWQPASVKWL